MNEVELKIYDMSSTLHPSDAYALVLMEAQGERKLPVIIGHQEAQAIKVMMVRYKAPRPLTHDLFPALTGQLGVTLKKVLIYKVKDGVFYSYLHFEKEDGEVIKIDSRTSDAVALALRYQCPIYTTEAIMQSEYLRDLGGGAYSVTVNTISLPMLKEALVRMIEKEDYEQASRLRDEIRRREQENNHK